MLMMSTRSRMRPSPFGSSAKSIACSSAMPLHEVRRRGAAFSAYTLAPGATPSLPAMMSATCVPWPPKVVASGAPIGSGSGQRGRRVRPALADEVVATDDLGAREQAVVGGGARVVDRPGSRCPRQPPEWPARRGRQRRPCGFICGLRARTAERLVRVVDAAVDDGDANALAARAERLRGVGADVRHGFGEILARSRTRRPRA